jgi:hypothetical protein
MATALLQKLSTKWLYKKSTGYLLNIVTLNILDEKINK